MAIQFSAATYADFKTFMSMEAFKGEIFYIDNPETAQNLAFEFNVYAIDLGRRILITLMLSGQTDQKPPTFSVDFPSAVQLSSTGTTTMSTVQFVAD